MGLFNLCRIYYYNIAHVSYQNRYEETNKKRILMFYSFIPHIDIHCSTTRTNLIKPIICYM